MQKWKRGAERRERVEIMKSEVKGCRSGREAQREEKEWRQ